MEEEQIPQTPYEKFTAAQEATLAKRSELNEQITLNRNAHALALKKFDDNMLRGNEAEAARAREECEKLDADLAWMQRTLDLISRDGGRHDPDVVDSGQAVLAYNRREMTGLMEHWENVAGNLSEARDAFIALVARLGEIQRAGAKLRTQNAHVLEVIGGQSGWVEAPGDTEVNVPRQKGIIYIDADEITRIYKTGRT